MKREAPAVLNETRHTREADRSTYRWCAHPAWEQPGRAAMGAVWIVAVAAVVYATTLNIFWPVFAVIFLVAALNRFYFPSRFMVDDDGITASSLLRTRRMRWVDVKRFVHDEQGGMLSDRAEPSRMDAYRGLHVMFGGKGREAVRMIEQQFQRTREGAGDH